MRIAERLGRKLDVLRQETPVEIWEVFEDGFRSLWLSHPAPGVPLGESAPDFRVSRADIFSTGGKAIRSAEKYLGPEDLLGDGKFLVLNFIRGNWCPYCRAELGAYQDLYQRLKKEGGVLVTISPQAGEKINQISEPMALPIISDPEQKIARSFKLVYPVPGPTKELYRKKMGVDLGTENANGQWELPVPATYVLDRDRMVIGRYVEHDFTRRMEPERVLQMLVDLNSYTGELVAGLKKKNILLENQKEEIEKLQIRLMDNERRAMVGELMSGMAHEIKNLLNPVAGLEILREDIEPEKKFWLDMVMEARDQIVDLVHEVGALARRQKTSLKLTELDLPATLNYCLRVARLDRSVSGFVTELRPIPTVRVRANRGKVLQVLLNLIRNAAQACEGRENGKITLEARKENEFVWIQVSDNGPGIPPADQAKIWQSFFSGKKSSGFGLGLAISRQIIENHGGQMGLESEIGAGARFWFTLPLA